MFAYKITNLVNGKGYIGITKNAPAMRWKGHLEQVPHRSTALYSAIKKYGKAAFKFEVLAEAASWAELLVLERGLIAEHGTYAGAHGYNMTAGGDGTMTPSQETIARLRAANIGRKHTPETVAKIIANTTGKSPSKETRLKMSLARIGKKRSPETVAKVAAANLGKKRSEETKARLRIVKRRENLSAETRAKMSAAHTARAADPVIRANMRTARLGTVDSPETKERKRIAQQARRSREAANEAHQ
jgi:group I intron endonuclease